MSVVVHDCNLSTLEALREASLGYIGRFHLKKTRQNKKQSLHLKFFLAKL
jgi:hypothetical protein